MIHNLRHWLLFAITFAFIPGCASLGVLTPHTFAERIAHAQAQVTAARTAAAKALDARAITADDARHVQELADKAREGLDAARRLNTIGVGSGAEDRLTLAQGLLRELAEYLARRGVKQ